MMRHEHHGKEITGVNLMPSSPEPIHLDAVILRQRSHPQNGEDTMKMILLTIVVLVAFASPAFADFYVVQDTNTKECSIVEQRPTDASQALVGGAAAMYKDRAGAENALRNSVLCRPSTTGSGAGAPGAKSPAPPAPPAR